MRARWARGFCLLFFAARCMILHYFKKLSMYEDIVTIDLEATGSTNVNADLAADHSERREGPLALERINAAMENTLKLQASLSNLRYSSASVCRTMVDDMFIGLADLRRFVTEANAGDTAAAAKIPGVIQALKESLNFEELLKGNRGYMKGGERVYAGYIYETIAGLSSSFNSVSEAVLPLTEGAEVASVRYGVRSQLNAIGGYNFNTKEGIKNFAEKITQVQPVITVEETKPLPLNINWDLSAKKEATLDPAPFTAFEEAWFKSETLAPASATAAPTKARAGFFSRVMSTLGGLAESVTRRLPQLGGAAALALAACGPTTSFEEIPTAPEPLPSIPAATVPSIAPAAPADWNISDTRDITHAVRSALMNKCGMTRAQAISIEGTIVHDALVTNTDDLKNAVGAKKASDTDGKWLTAVTTDEARYGNTIPNDYAQVQGDVGHSRLVGAHNVSAESVSNMAYSALPVFSTYTCPSF